MKTLGNSADRQEILGRIAMLAQTDEAKWGKMSVDQMICHLRDSYCVALGEKTVSPATGFLQRTLLKWVALWVPLKWMKNFPTRPEVDQGKGGSPPTEFEADRKALREIFLRFSGSLPQPCCAHPSFGVMGTHEWWRWGYLHADHHLRQFGR